MKTFINYFMGACLLVSVGNAPAAVVAGANYTVDTYYANPHAETRLVSFDWDDNNNLYYSTGDPYWGLGFSVYKFDGATAVNLYTDSNAFSGSRVTAIGGRIYFNDGGTYSRWTCDYYRYDPVHQSAPVNMNVQSDIYGLETRNGADFWAAGGYAAAIYYSPLDANGGLASNPLVKLGTIGNASGPVAFDANGNLYYVEGYVTQGRPTVYRWSAAEVAAAIANPSASPLNPANHAWATLSSGDGATGLLVDDFGNLVVTATSFTDPSEVHRLLVCDGTYVGYQVLARSDTRLETLRIRNGAIYVSVSDGIYVITPDQATRIPFLADFDGDRKCDPALYQASSGTWKIKFYARGYEEVTFSMGGANQQAVPADFDGDRKADPAVYNEITGDWQVKLSGSDYAAVTIHAFGGAGCIPVVRDFDGDGKVDPAIYRQTTGSWEVKLSANNYASALLTGFGGTGYEPVAMDYDGDGKADPAIYRESDGKWTVKLSGNNYQPLDINGFGGAGYQALPGMFDHASRANPVIYKADEGNWTILLSAENYLTATLWGFGGAGYIPVAGDCDGDGKADPAVYNAALTAWYIKLSGSGYRTETIAQ